MSTRNCLTGPKVWYVDLAGNDVTGDGSLIKPWLTPQYAVNFIQLNYDFCGYQATLQINDGNWYVPVGLTTFCGITGPCTGANGNAVTLNIIGNQTSPQNCVINLTGGQYGFAVGDAFIGQLFGFQFNGPTSGPGAIPILISNFAQLDFGDMIFNTNSNGINVFVLGLGSALMLGTNISIIGNAAIHFACQGGAQFKAATQITIPTALTFVQFLQAANNARCDVTHITLTGAGVSGCIGQKGNAYIISEIIHNGNPNVLPGNGGWVHDTFNGSVIA